MPQEENDCKQLSFWVYSVPGPVLSTGMHCPLSTLVLQGGYGYHLHFVHGETEAGGYTRWENWNLNGGLSIFSSLPKCTAMWLILPSPDYNGETKAQGIRSAGSPCVSSEVVGRKGEKGAWRRWQFPALCGEEPAQMSSAPSAQRSPPGSQYSDVRSYLCHGYAVFWEGLQKSLCGLKKK